MDRCPCRIWWSAPAGAAQGDRGFGTHRARRGGTARFTAGSECSQLSPNRASLLRLRYGYLEALEPAQRAYLLDAQAKPGTGSSGVQRDRPFAIRWATHADGQEAHVRQRHRQAGIRSSKQWSPGHRCYQIGCYTTVKPSSALSR